MLFKPFVDNRLVAEHEPYILHHLTLVQSGISSALFVMATKIDLLRSSLSFWSSRFIFHPLVGIKRNICHFSEKASLDIPFNKYENSKEFSTAVDDVTYEGSSTRLDRALHACAERMFTEKNGARSEDVLKVVLIITDGTQTYKGKRSISNKA